MKHSWSKYGDPGMVLRCVSTKQSLIGPTPGLDCRETFLQLCKNNLCCSHAGANGTNANLSLLVLCDVLHCSLVLLLDKDQCRIFAEMKLAHKVFHLQLGI